jgi:type II secretory pathway pseudopilin PulG
MDEERSVCPSCKREIDDVGVYCPFCGSPLGESPVGNEVQEQDHGTGLGQAPTSSQQQASHQNMYSRYPYPPQQQGPYPEQKNDGNCIASLVLGILSLITPCLGLVFAILAIVFGIKGTRNVDHDPRASTGKGLGTAGVVLGVVGLAAAVLYISIGIPVFVAARDSAQEKACFANQRMFLSAADIFAAETDSYPTASAIEAGEISGSYGTNSSPWPEDYYGDELDGDNAPLCPSGGKIEVIYSSDGTKRPKITCNEHGSASK